jgi:hypothetical protein
MTENEKTNIKPPQPTATNMPPAIVAKPGGSENGTKLRMFEANQGKDNIN